MRSSKMKVLIETDQDFIASKRFGFSLKKLLERYPEGAPDKVIAQALLLSEAELVELEKTILNKLRAGLQIQLD